MRNEYFLKKAKSLEKELNVTEFEIPCIDKILTDGDEVIYDCGNHHVGYVDISFSSVGHHQDAPLYFQIQFAEIEEEFHQDVDTYHGWISKSWIQEERIHIDVLPCTYALKRRYAFRYIKVKILSVSSNFSVKIDRIHIRSVSSANDQNVVYPQFSEREKVLDTISLRTLHSCMQRVFEDGPKRDRRLWLGDLRLEALANYYTFQNNDLVKKCLYLFAGTTLEEGRLANNLFLEPEIECDYQTMFDYTLFYISVLWNYYEHTNDIETVKELEPVCMKQYTLLKECFDENHVIDMERVGNVFIDWNLELDKQAAAQAIYLYCLKDLCEIEKVLGKDTNEIEEEIRNKTKAACTFYDEEKGLFVSGKDRQLSYASQVWMVLAKVVDSEKGQIILRNLEHVDALELNSPYGYHHYIQALIDVGLKEEAYEKMLSYWGGMVQEGSSTFWEIYNPHHPKVSPYGGLVVHSFCHAWSCTPTYFLRKYFHPDNK